MDVRRSAASAAPTTVHPLRIEDAAKGDDVLFLRPCFARPAPVTALVGSFSGHGRPATEHVVAFVAGAPCPRAGLYWRYSGNAFVSSRTSPLKIPQQAGRIAERARGGVP